MSTPEAANDKAPLEVCTDPECPIMDCASLPRKPLVIFHDFT
ncbi:hypothetical protein CVT26_004610, partial [Gymnopilus dilepis]